MDTPPPINPRLQAALDDLARSVAKLEHLLPALEGFDGNLKNIVQNLQGHAGTVAGAHGRAATIAAVQRADASAREVVPAAGPVSVLPGQEKTSAG